MSKAHDLWTYLFLREHRVFIPALPESEAVDKTPALALSALEAELAEFGFALSGLLLKRLAAGPVSALTALRARLLTALQAERGAAYEEEAIFGAFPEVPPNTEELRWRRLLVHFLQSEEQPCLYCGEVGYTQLLAPCGHGVCAYCWDPEDHDTCPVCGGRVDPSAPYFLKVPRDIRRRWATRPLPDNFVLLPKEVRRRWRDKELPDKRKFIRLELCEDQAAEARVYFERLCARRLPLSRSEQEGLDALIGDYGEQLMAWLPAKTPQRINLATIFGKLARAGDPVAVFSRAKERMPTATDVLRFIAALSGADPALISGRGHGVVIRRADVQGAPRASRFTVAKLPRALRRAILAQLDGLAENSLIEDMLRHRAHWKWVGRFLHPHEYAERFPSVEKAFQIIHRKAPDGSLAPRFSGFNSKLERCLGAGDVPGSLALLRQQPRRLARRVDQLLRLSAGDPALEDAVLAALTSKLGALATPRLITLLAHLLQRGPREAAPPPRVFWPRGTRSLRGWRAETRPPLPARALRIASEALQAELLGRFRTLPRFSAGILDRQLASILAPSAPVPKAAPAPGSSLQVAPGARCRLFLRWCELTVPWAELDLPEGSYDFDWEYEGAQLELSVSFHDEDWEYMGACAPPGADAGANNIAKASDHVFYAPPPAAATQFVDIDRAAALAAGVRYAVLLVTAESALSLSAALDWAYVGVEVDGPEPFDPRAAGLSFALVNEDGPARVSAPVPCVYMPLVLDLSSDRMHWLGVHRRPELDNGSKAPIQTLAPILMSYFQSGARPSVYQLGLLQLAARAELVYLRGAQGLLAFSRGEAESVGEFYARLCAGAGGTRLNKLPAGDEELLAILLDGDLCLPAGSRVYALFAGACNSNLDFTCR